MKNFESIFILKSDVTEEQVANVIEDIKKIVVNVKNIEKWGNKKLAYPIKKHTEGYYVRCEFQNEDDKEVEKYYKDNELIIKHIIVIQED